MGGQYKAWGEEWPKWREWTDALRPMKDLPACASALRALVEQEVRARSFDELLQQATIFWRDRKIESAEHKVMVRQAADLGLSSRMCVARTIPWRTRQAMRRRPSRPNPLPLPPRPRRTRRSAPCAAGRSG